MRITIIGAGNMGRGVGTRAIAGGHEVEILDRDPAEAQALADQLGGSASVLDPSAGFGGEIVVFAVYYPGIKDAVQEYSDVGPLSSGAAARAARLSAHLAPAAARRRLRQHDQGPSVTRWAGQAVREP